MSNDKIRNTFPTHTFANHFSFSLFINRVEAQYSVVRERTCDLDTQHETREKENFKINKLVEWWVEEKRKTVELVGNRSVED